MKNFKKVLVLLVAVAMVFSMVPSTSFAWADTENVVDTGDDSSSVFDVSEENETETEEQTDQVEEPVVRAAAGTISGFSAELKKDGLTNKNGNWVKVMADSAAGQFVKYNVVWTVDVPNDSYDAGELEIRLPKSIFYHYVVNKLDGTLKTDENGNLIKELDQKTTKYNTYEVTFSPGFPYTLTEDGDDLVLTNNQTIANTQSIYQFDIKYFMTHESFDYADYEDHTADMSNSEAHTCTDCGSRPVEVIITDKSSGNEYKALADEVYIDTSAKISSVHKESSYSFYAWNVDTYGPREANYEQYNYVQYMITVEMETNPTERYKLDLTDTFQDKIDGQDGIVAYRIANTHNNGTSYSGYIGDPVVFEEPQKNVTISLDNCTQKYALIFCLVRTKRPTDTSEYSWLKIDQYNKVTVKATPLCGKNSEMSNGSGDDTFQQSFEYTYPTGMFMVNKFGCNNISRYMSSYVWPASSFGLADFQNDPDSELESFRYVVEFYGTALPLTNNTGTNDPEGVGKKPVIWELTDDTSYMTLEKEPVLPDDYYLRSIGIEYDSHRIFGEDTADAHFNVATGEWVYSRVGSSNSGIFDNDIITLYVQKGNNTDWIKAADIKCNYVLEPDYWNYACQKFSLTPINTDVTGDITITRGFISENGHFEKSGATISFETKDITGYRITNENKHARFKMTVLPEFILKHSEHVDGLVEGKDRIEFYNEADLAVYEYDPNNNGEDVFKRRFIYSGKDLQEGEGCAQESYQVRRKAIDYAIAERRRLEVDKSFIGGENVGAKEAFVNTWRLNSGVWATGRASGYASSQDSMGGSEAGYEQLHGGRFYDLLPKGTGVDIGSIKVYKVRALTSGADGYLRSHGEEYLLEEGEDYNVSLTYDSSAKQYMFVVDIKEDSLAEMVSVSHAPTYNLYPGYTVFFDSETSWTAMDDYGTTITNVVGFKTDGLNTITFGNNADNVEGSELKDLEDQERFNVDYNYTIAKMKSVVDENRDVLAFDFAYSSTTVDYTTSSVSGVFKRVQGQNDASPSKETKVEPGDTYRYSLRYQSGAVKEVKDIVIYDNIENYGTWDWRGTFKGIDLSELPDEITPTVYYTEQDVDFAPYISSGNPPINDTDLNWQELTSSTDLSKVRSIAISMGDYAMGSYSALNVWLEFEAPSENDTDKPLPVAQNDVCVSCTQNAYTTVAPGNFVKVELEVLGELKIHKTDETGKPIESVQFTIEGTDKFGRDVKVTGTTNSRGNLTLSGLPISGTEGYTLTETAPSGYVDEGRTWTVVVDTDGSVSVDGEETSDVYYDIVNISETSVEVTKEWANINGTFEAPDGASVVLTLYADGEDTGLTVTLDGTKDDNEPAAAGGFESKPWEASFIHIPRVKMVEGEAVPIVYTVKETGTWPGYRPSPEDAVPNGGLIINTQVPTEVSVTKAWENLSMSDDAPKDAEVTFTLYSDGTATNYTVTLDGTPDTAVTTTGGYESEAWKATFVKLPKYKVVNGVETEIKYTVQETGTWPGYTVSYEGENATYAVDGGTITNTQEMTGVSVTKAWQKADGTTTAPDGAKVTFTLYADGVDTGYSVTLEGIDNADSIMQGGQETPAWTATFVRLPKYKAVDGEAVEIEYTVQETGTWPGYTVSYGDGTTATYAVDGGTITNTEETVSLAVKKAWMNADGSTTAPDGAKVTFTLYADGEATDITCELDGSEDEEVPAYTGAYELNPWQANFDELPKYKIENGKAVEIEYTVQETGTWPGYTVSYGDGTTATYAVAGGTITNTQETTGLSVTKAWKNADGSTTAPAGAQVTFTLYGDGEPTGFSVTLVGIDNAESIMQGGQETPAWTASFVRLPKYKIENGKAVEIEYTVQETGEWPGYTVSYGDNEETFAVDGGVITNEQITTEIGGTKTWNDDEFFVDGVPVNGYQRPESITIDLLADGTVIDSVTVTEDDEWEYEFTDLPKYKIVDGQAVEIEYTVAEETVPGYAAVVEGTDVENTPVKDENVAPTMMFLRKVDALTWTEPVIDDPDDPDDPEEPAMRAESVDIPGLGGAEFLLTDPDGIEKTLTTDENGTLTIEFTKDGTYTLQETKAPDGYVNPGTLYTITVDKVFQRVELVDDENAPGGKVWRWFYQLEADVDADYDANTNTLTVKDPPELINIEGEKIWDDGNDIEGKRPKNITVELFADGEKIDEQVVTSANNWKFTFTDLPKMKDGKEIVYTIGEVPIKGYTTTIEGFKITNKHEVKTGDEMNLGLWISIMIMAIAAMCILGVARLLKRR